MKKKTQTKKKTNSKYYFDRSAGLRVVKFIETFCRHTKGEWAGKQIKLAKWQKDQIIIPAFGHRRISDGMRQYRTIYVEIPRKNGKSTLAAPIALYLTMADGEGGAEVYTAAGDKEQARIVYGVARDMIAQDPILEKAVESLKDSIFHKKSMSVMKVISAEAYTKHGFNSHGIVIDELHVQPNRELYDTLVTSTGARSQPMTFIITTAGVKDTFAESVHDYALQVQKGIIKDETFLPVIFAADEKDDPFIEATWKKANPGYGTIIKKDYFRMQSNRAKNEPTFLNSFLRLHLNIWTGSTTAFIASHDWDKCNHNPILLENLKGRECYGGLDLASVRDIAALVFNFPNEETGVNDIYCKFYCPAEMIHQRRQKNENHNYAVWEKQGWLTTTPGNAIDFNFIKKDIHEIGGEVVIKAIAFDRWNASQIVQDLMSDGLEMAPFGQGFASMSTPTKALEKMVLEKNINHGGNPILAWMINNTQTVEDPAGNIKPAKNKSKGKIDGVIALVESIGEQITRQNDKPKKNKYNDPNSQLLIL